MVAGCLVCQEIGSRCVNLLHYNYKYDWLRPTLEEIVDAYTKLYGKESRESDIESDGS